MAECVTPIGPEEALEKLKDQVTCAVCLQSYSKPKVLQCFHIFCQDCLKKLVIREGERLSVTCAICRKETALTVSGKGVSDLPSAFHMNNLLEIEGGLKRVAGIRKSVREHSKQDTTKKRRKQQITCLHHPGEFISLFCESCTELICIKCTVLTHNGHRYDLIKEAFEKTSKELITCLEPAEVNLNRIKRAMSNYCNRGEQIAVQQGELESEINSIVAKYQAALETKRKDLLDQLKKLAREKSEKLKDEKSKLQEMELELTSCIEETQKKLENENEELVLMTREPLKRKIQDICSETRCDDLEPSEKANMVLSVNLEPALQSLEALAIIDTYKVCPEMSYATGSGLALATISSTKVLLHVVDYNSTSCKDDCSKHIQCKVESAISGSIVCGGVRRRRENQYEITYQPMSKGQHQLHITVHQLHIKGSPFPVTVKSTHTSLNSPFWSIRCIKQPCGLALNDSRELLAVSDQEEGIFVLKHNDDILRKLGTGSFMDITVAEDQSIYVVDSHNHQVLHLTPEGYTIGSTAKQHKTPEGLNYPMGVAYNSKNKKLYVSNTYNHNIKVLEADLSIYKTVGEKGKGKGQFNYPWGIACDISGKVLVADSENDRVQIFTPEGKFVRQFGRRGEKPGELIWPIGIAVDSAGLVYVSEGGNHRVSIFGMDGQFVRCFSEGCGLKTPRGLVVDSSSGIVFLCDYDTNCIQLY